MPTRHRQRSQRATKGGSRRKSHRPLSPEAKHFAITAAAANKYGVPVWLLWGIAGAESTWGKGGSNLFGLLAAAEGANTGNWKSAANQAAKTLAGLHKQYGSWSAAVEHYSGGYYTIKHPAELAAGNPPPAGSVSKSGQTAAGQAQFVGLGEELLPGAGGHVLENFLNPLHLQPFGSEGPSASGPQLNPFTAEGKGGLLGFPEELVQAGSAVTALITALLDIHFWIRVGEALAGLILIYMGLHALTGQGPSTGIVRRYGEAAAFKRLPPKTRTAS